MSDTGKIDPEVIMEAARKLIRFLDRLEAVEEINKEMREQSLHSLEKTLKEEKLDE